MLDYGMNYLWPTPMRVENLLEEGLVGQKLHSWLEKYADQSRFISRPLSITRNNTRYDESAFVRPACAELARIREILIAQADRYARETIQNPLPEHEKEATFFFVIQRPNNLVEALLPHYHEKSDVGVVYYLATPSNGSGVIIMFDPRGLIARGGRAFMKQMPAIQYSPRRGDLLILPRYIMHYTTANTDVHSRKVITGLLRYDLPRRLAQKDLIKQEKCKSRRSVSN